MLDREPIPDAMAEASDEMLLSLVAQKDQAAMTQLFRRHSRLVYSIASRVLKSQTQAEDVLQEVFMQVWKRPPLLDAARGRFTSLLAVAARNRAIDTLRGHKQGQLPEGFDAASTFDLASDSERRILLNRVREVADTLSREQQEVLNLAFFEGLTHSEIASSSNLPLGTVKTRIRAALQALGRTLAV